MANLMASHGATAMDRAVTFSTALAAVMARLAAWHDARHLRRLDDQQRRHAGLVGPDAPGVSVQPGWDVRLQGLR